MSYYRATRTCLLTLSLLIPFLTLSLHAKGFRYVIIDPGHGGHDKGARNGLVYEKHLALDTALRLEHYLKQHGIRTRMTRRSDVFIPLSVRAAIGNRYRKSIFVSIHYNHTWKRDPKGLETYYYSSEGRKLADQVQRRISRKIRTPNRGVKHARFFVLRHARNPSILVECGFISNRQERGRMKKAWYRQSLAEGIGEGILRYKHSR